MKKKGVHSTRRTRAAGTKIEPAKSIRTEADVATQRERDSSLHNTVPSDKSNPEGTAEVPMDVDVPFRRITRSVARAAELAAASQSTEPATRASKGKGKAIEVPVPKSKARGSKRKRHELDDGDVKGVQTSHDKIPAYPTRRTRRRVDQLAAEVDTPVPATSPPIVQPVTTIPDIPAEPQATAVTPPEGAEGLNNMVCRRPAFTVLEVSGDTSEASSSRVSLDQLAPSRASQSDSIIMLSSAVQKVAIGTSRDATATLNVPQLGEASQSASVSVFNFVDPSNGIAIAQRGQQDRIAAARAAIANRAAIRNNQRQVDARRARPQLAARDRARQMLRRLPFFQKAPSLLVDFNFGW